MDFIPEDDNEHNQLADFALSSSLADDTSCVGSDVDTTQSFGRNRRSNICRDPPKGSEVGGQGFEKNPERDPFSLQQYLQETIRVHNFFKSSEELCPARIFSTSTIPVCSNQLVSVIHSVPPYAYVNIVDVFPGMLVFE